MEYTCRFEFAGKSGDCRLVLTDEELCCVTSLDQYAIPLADITSFEVANWRLMIRTEKETFTASMLGEQLEPIRLELTDKYNAKVLKAFFVQDNPVLETAGEFAYTDEGGTAQGEAQIKLFPRCLCILPPNDTARRVPLCFLTNIEKGNYRWKLTLDTGETYELIRMGWDTEAFETQLNACMEAIRKNAVAAALALDSTLSTAQSYQIARWMPEGVSAPLSALASVSPSYVAALEAKITESRAADTYAHFKEICQPAEILAGMKSDLAGEEEKNILWVVAGKTHGDTGAAALEMALSEDTAAATYVYKFTGSWEAFWRRLDHAVEAINFKREVIYLSDEDLNKRENALYKMAVARTPALRFLRASHAGRVIHSSLEAWKKNLDKMFE